jgi:hypothetical protein
VHRMSILPRLKVAVDMSIMQPQLPGLGHSFCDELPHKVSHATEMLHDHPHSHRPMPHEQGNSGAIDAHSGYQ